MKSQEYCAKYGNGSIFSQSAEETTRMWMLNGIALGLGIFLVGTIIYVGNKMRPFTANKATGLSVITGPTWHNALWWGGLVVTLILACWLVRPTSVP